MDIITFANAFISLRGKWKCHRRYRYLDAVFYEGSLYIANKKHICTGISPECNKAWMLAAKGIDEEKNAEQIKKFLSEHEELIKKLLSEHEALMDERITSYEEETAKNLSKHKEEVEKRLSEHEQETENHISEYEKKIEKQLAEHETQLDERISEQKEQTEKLISDHAELPLESGAHSFPQGEEGQYLTLKENKLTWVTNDTRTPITKSTTFYVRTDGDDANDGSEDTKDKAFKTIQRCLDYIYEHYTQAHGDVIIRIGEGTFKGFELNGGHMGIHHMFIYGAGKDKTIVINNTSSNCVYVGSYKRVLLQDIKFVFNDSVGLTESANIIFSDLYSYVRLHDCVTEVNETVGTYKIQVYVSTNFSTIDLNATNIITVKSDVKSSNVFICVASRRSTVHIFNTVKVSGNMCMFAQINDFSYLYIQPSIKLSGTMTGTRYNVFSSSAINVQGKGTNFLPGDKDGTSTTGSMYY